MNNTAVFFVGGSHLIIEGVSPKLVRGYMNTAMKENRLMDIAMAKKRVEGINPANVCFISGATLTKKEAPE